MNKGQIITLDDQRYAQQCIFSNIEIENCGKDQDFWDYMLKSTLSQFMTGLVDLKKQKYDVNLNMLITFNSKMISNGLKVEINSYNINNMRDNE